MLLGVTGSGKTFTMAKIIEELNRPALMLAHNKTLAAQLYHEFKQFFPEQRGRVLCLLLRLLPARGLHSLRRPVHREGSHHQRRAGQAAAFGDPVLFERRDAIIVSSVSCIYGLGSPEAYYGMLLLLEKGQSIRREDITRRLVENLV